MVYLYFFVLVLSFAVLFKCADWFVKGASGIARVMSISKMIVGIVLVGMATTAPEFFVSVQASFLGHPEIALGNAIGSVICDDGIAVALAGILAPAAIYLNCRTLKVVSLFLISIDILAFILIKNGTIGRLEGTLFLFILLVYFIMMYKGQKANFFQPARRVEKLVENEVLEPSSKKKIMKKCLLYFFGGITGVVITSNFVIWAAVRISKHFNISETIIGLTVVAIGTSLPEISTSITAALKGEGEIAVGNIIGADILNILWIIGVASVVNPIKVEVEIINFTFPYMIFIVLAMLGLMRIGCRWGRFKGLFLFTLYLVYIFLTLKFFI